MQLGFDLASRLPNKELGMLMNFQDFFPPVSRYLEVHTLQKLLCTFIYF